MEGMPTIEVSQERAKAELALFKKIRKEHRRKEDQAFMQAYRAAAKGNALISLDVVMEWAGVHEDTGLPKLAISRADAELCYYQNRWGTAHFTIAQWTPKWQGSDKTPRPDFDAQGWRKHHRFPGVAGSWPETGREVYRTPVPIIPPSLRPPWKLSNYHLLWEVASWERVPLQKGDPLLLRHLRGDLYAVLAAWDMTPLEASILNERLM